MAVVDSTNNNTNTIRNKKGLLISISRIVYVIGVLLLNYFYFWDHLVNSLDGSTLKASLIVVCMIVFGLVNTNDLVGQPHDHDD